MRARRVRQFGQRWAVTLGLTAAGGLLFGWIGLGVGTLLGLAVDWQRERWPYHPYRWRRLGVASDEAAVLSGVFVWAGAVAKADGRVSEAEIRVTEGLMGEHGLDVRGRRLAIELFQRGKADDHARRLLARRLVDRLAARPEGLHRVLAQVARVATADGGADAAQRRLLERLALLLGFAEAEALHHLRRARPAPAGERHDRLQAAYDALGVDPASPNAEVRRAYRRLVSRHHPDRVLARQGADDEVRAAAARTHAAREAYEAIRRARGF